MSAKNTLYYTIQSSTSRNSVHGLRPRIGSPFSAADLIGIAAEECGRQGTTLEDLAEIAWIEQADGTFLPSREWAEGEQLAAAVKKLGDDGKLFEIYPDTQTGRDEYCKRALELGLDDDLDPDIIAETSATVRAALVIAAKANQEALQEFFEGLASCDYYDGLSYQLYLDLDDNSLSIHQEVSSNSWLQRDDGSLIQVYQVSGYCDTPEDERYTVGCDINDYGYADWLNEIEAKIAQRLSTM